MKFSIGDLVVEKKDVHPRISYNVQKVVATLDNTLLLTHHGFAFGGKITSERSLEGSPGSRSWRQSIQRFQEDELFTLDEALQELQRLEAEKSKLDTEFENVRGLIQEKMDQATNFVKEAAALAKPFDKDFFDLKKECMTLYRALDENGWSHSHMRC